MADSDYPRVLIVGQAFNLSTGGGITLSNLFKGWPKDRLAVAGIIEHTPNLEVCEQYYQLGSPDLSLIYPFNHIWPYSNPFGPLDIENSTRTITTPSRNQQRNWLRKSVHHTVGFLGAEQLIRQVRYQSEFQQWIANFAPDLLYTQAASLHVIELSRKIINDFRLPYVIHMMDDWPKTLYTGTALAPILRRKLKMDFTPLIEGATSLMGISGKMCREYQERYHRSCLPFHNAIELAQWSQFARMNCISSNPFRLFYAGRIGIANTGSLRKVCEAVKTLYKRGVSVRLDLYTLDYNNDFGKAYQDNECIFVAPPIPYVEMPKALANADLLILPLDFDKTSVLFAQYSMPTKAPEYMASGTPILIFAPEEMAVVEYAQREKWGYVVSKDSTENLQLAIVDLIENQTLRERLSIRAKAMVEQNHDAVNVRASFRQALFDAATSRDHMESKFQ